MGMHTTRRGTLAITTVLLAALFGTAWAVDEIPVTAKDRDFVRQQRARMRSSPEYRNAIRSVEKLEGTLKGERKVPYDAKVQPARLREPALPIVVNPAMRRTVQPGVAIIVFDITGSGRVTGQELIAANPQRPWGEEALQMMGDWLFEPTVEGDVGVTRVGVTVAIYAEMDGAGSKCGVLKAQTPTDLESRQCVKAR
jgi:hypothetical protein